MVLHRPARPGGPMTAPQTESPAGASRATVTPTPDNATTGQLIGQLTEQISRLVRDEARLAQAEVTQKAKRLGVGAGLFGGAGLFAFLDRKSTRLNSSHANISYAVFCLKKN